MEVGSGCGGGGGWERTLRRNGVGVAAGRSGWYERPNKTRFFGLVMSRWPKGPTCADSNFVAEYVFSAIPNLEIFLYFLFQFANLYECFEIYQK
jgi:hypothetical protein